MKIVIPGGTGQVGTVLARAFHGDGHEVVVLGGAVNLSAPNPLPYKDFMAILRRAWGTRIGLPATRWMLAMGAFLMRTETELVLKSRRVVPGRLLQEGFSFRHPHWKEAAADLVERWRSALVS